MSEVERVIGGSILNYAEERMLDPYYERAFDSYASGKNVVAYKLKHRRMSSKFEAEADHLQSYSATYGFVALICAFGAVTSVGRSDKLAIVFALALLVCLVLSVAMARRGTKRREKIVAYYDERLERAWDQFVSLMARLAGDVQDWVHRPIDQVKDIVVEKLVEIAQRQRSAELKPNRTIDEDQAILDIRKSLERHYDGYLKLKLVQPGGFGRYYAAANIRLGLAKSEGLPQRENVGD